MQTDASSGELPEERTPVLVAGGGLVGLATALLLAQHGVAAVVVEKHAGTAVHPRARGFQPPTVELLAPSGVAAAMIEAGVGASPGTALGVLRAVTLRGPVLDWRTETVGPAATALSPYPLVAIGQDRLEPMLLAAARRAGADVRFGTRLLGFAADGDAVDAIVETLATGARRRIRADYLV